MLVPVISTFLFLLILFLLATSKLVAKLEDSPYVNVFYVLMFITFMTLLQVVFCVYMYLKFRTKDGEEGPRGYQGFPGEKGDPGVCDQSMCRGDTIRVMIEKIFEKKLNRELKPEEKNIIYSQRMIYNTKVKATAFKNKSEDVEVKNMNQEDIRDLYQYLTKQIELDYIRLDTLDNYIIDIQNIFS